MKIVKGDKVIVIAGRNRGVQGSVLAVLPKKNQVVVEGVNVAKRHTKPSASNPKGGILELTRPIDVSKVMAIDPKSGKPARIGYKISANGKKERIYRVSSFSNPKAKKPAAKTSKTTKDKS